MSSAKTPLLLRGKWMFIHDPERWNHEVHRFVVDYIDERGEFKKAYSRTPFTDDIKEAILRGGYA